MEEVKQYMMETSPMVRLLPRKLFHASPKRNLESILLTGLKPHAHFGQTYFCSTKKQCLSFTGDNVYVFEVDTTKLKRNMFRLSLDHNKTFYPFDCYAYYDDIPVEAITKVHEPSQAGGMKI